MKIRRRILALTVTLCMITGLIVSPAHMEKTWAAVSGNYEYESLSATTVKITKYTGSDTELEIPGSLDGGTVSEIGEAAFKYNRVLTKVGIPNGVTKIGSGAFCDCRGLKEINFPNSMQSIGYCAFERMATAIPLALDGGLR